MSFCVTNASRIENDCDSRAVAFELGIEFRGNFFVNDYAGVYLLDA